MDNFQLFLGAVTMGVGTIYPITDIRGMGLGEKRARLYQRPGADGVDFGKEWRDGPVITIEGLIKTPGDPAACWAGFVALRDAFDGTNRLTPMSVEQLIIRWPGTGDFGLGYNGRPDRFDANSMSKLNIGLIPWTGTFVCQVAQGG